MYLDQIMTLFERFRTSGCSCIETSQENENSGQHCSNKYICRIGK